MRSRHAHVSGLLREAIEWACSIRSHGGVLTPRDVYEVCKSPTNMYSKLFHLTSTLTLCLLLVACGSANTPAATATPEAPATDNPITIVAVGDSLTEGLGLDEREAYPAQLEQRLRDDGYNVNVINAGVSGETSSGARSRLDWVLQAKPDIVILETGPNDGLRGIDPELTGENLDAMVSTLQESNVIIVLAGMQIVQNMGETYTAAFRAIYPQVADAHDGVILVPFFLDGVGGVPALNQADAVHPTAKGYAIVVKTIYPYVVEAIEKVR